MSDSRILAALKKTLDWIEENCDEGGFSARWNPREDPDLKPAFLLLKQIACKDGCDYQDQSRPTIGYYRRVCTRCGEAIKGGTSE